MISKDDVKKLANLSRIKVADEELDKLSQDMNGILGYVEQIQKALGTVPEQKELNRNVLRPDENPHESGVHTEAILENAPARKGDYIKVKKILG